MPPVTTRSKMKRKRSPSPQPQPQSQFPLSIDVPMQLVSPVRTQQSSHQQSNQVSNQASTDHSIRLPYPKPNKPHNAADNDDSFVISVSNAVLPKLEPNPTQSNQQRVNFQQTAPTQMKQFITQNSQNNRQSLDMIRNHRPDYPPPAKIIRIDNLAANRQSVSSAASGANRHSVQFIPFNVAQLGQQPSIPQPPQMMTSQSAAAPPPSAATNNPKQWKTSDVITWLLSFAIGRNYLTEFAKHNISGNFLLQIDDNQLRRMNVLIESHRKEILNRVNTLRLMSEIAQIPFRCFYCPFMHSRREITLQHMATTHKIALPVFLLPPQPQPQPQPQQTQPPSQQKLQLSNSQSYPQPINASAANVLTNISANNASTSNPNNETQLTAVIVNPVSIPIEARNSDDDSSMAATPDSQRFQCPTCKKTYSTVSYLRKHCIGQHRYSFSTKNGQITTIRSVNNSHSNSIHSGSSDDNSQMSNDSSVGAAALALTSLQHCSVKYENSVDDHSSSSSHSHSGSSFAPPICILPNPITDNHNNPNSKNEKGDNISFDDNTANRTVKKETKQFPLLSDEIEAQLHDFTCHKCNTKLNNGLQLMAHVAVVHQSEH